jgi:hypothetical protein
MVKNFRYPFICFIMILLLTEAYGQSPDFSGLKVMINPGHGGHDSDDRGMPNGFWESEGNLTKGLWLRDLLEDRNCEVIMSRVLNRTEDDLPLSVIAAMANDNNVDLFLSIHSNAGNQTSNYPMTIFNGKSEEPANPQAKIWAKILWEQLITIEATFWTLTAPRYIGDLTLNPSWTYGYGVLYPLVVPGIISEGSFHDYKPEMDRLLNIEYRKQEAWNMLFAMSTYFDLTGSEPFGIISGIVRDSLLIKDNYSIANSPDKYMNVNGAIVELLETGDSYHVDSVNTGFYMFDSIPPGTYNLVFSAKDYFYDTVEVEVSAHSFSYLNHWMTADKTMAPRVISSTPSEGDTINCFDPVRITFNMNMDSASVANAFSISPSISGTFSWDKHHLNVYFQPDIPYETVTRYSVTLNATAEHQWGVPLDSIITFSFVTGERNRYTLTNSFPMSGQTEVSPYLQFRLIFDAPLNNTSLINAIEIIPENGSSLGTRGATITTIEGEGHYYFSSAEDLEFNKNYRMKIHGSVKDENNIPLVEDIEIPFSTMEEPMNLVVIDEFDVNNGWIIDYESSTGIDGNSFLYRWTKTKRSGDASTLLRYQFLADNSECIIRPSAGNIELIENSNMIGLWVWGDLSQNSISITFDNESVAELAIIDFGGWNFCTAELPFGVSAIESLRITGSSGGATGGDIYLDALSQKYLTGIEVQNDQGKIIVYPNPLTGNMIWLKNYDSHNTIYQVFSIKGKLLQEGALNDSSSFIDLSEPARHENSLILKIVSGKEMHTIQIFNIQRSTSLTN